jgi:hypothetical protein
VSLALDGCGFRPPPPSARLPLLFRPYNPTRNAEAPDRPQIPVIMKA